MPNNVSPTRSSPSSASSSRRSSLDMGRNTRGKSSTARATIHSRHPGLRLGKLPDPAPIPPSLLGSPLLQNPDSIFRRGLTTPLRPSEEDERWLQDTVPLVSGSPPTPSKARRLSLSGGVREEGALIRRPPTQRTRSAQMHHRPSPSMPSMRSVMLSPPLVRPPRTAPGNAIRRSPPRQYSDSLLPVRQRCATTPFLPLAWHDRPDYFTGLPLRTQAR